MQYVFPNFFYIKRQWSKILSRERKKEERSWENIFKYNKLLASILCNDESMLHDNYLKPVSKYIKYYIKYKCVSQSCFVNDDTRVF